MNNRPKLRYVDIIPVETEQGEMLALRDPMGIADETILISREGLYVLQFFDGQHTQKEILRDCQRAFSVKLTGEILDDLIQHLDQYYYLDNERTAARKKQLEADLLKSGLRAAAHAGVSYPAEAPELRATLDGFFTSRKGAGAPGAVNGLATPRGLIAPHIDLRIGGSTYSYAYRRLAEAPPADVYVIIGTGHAGVRDLYSVLPVDFETPLGRVQTDTTFIRKLQERYPHEMFDDLFLHKTEHTIEFQLVFLQEVLGKRPFKIVPILSGFSYHIFDYPMFERERKIVADFTRALRETIAAYPGKVTVIASVDLSHVGPRYGDKSVPDSAFLSLVEKADLKALESVERGDAEGWNQAVAAIQDRYRICGFAPIYTLLASIPASHGEILHYDKGLMDDQKSVVSYCSAVLY